MSSIKPSQSTWTLRFKNHRTTVLLHTDRAQKFSSIKADLLKAIRQTHPHGKLNGHDIPEHHNDIVLAQPANINDLSAGWVSLEPKASDPEDKGKGKGKAAASSSGGKKAQDKTKPKDCPEGAGLRDGGIVAFKFRTSEEKADREWEKVESGDDGEAEIKIDEEDEEEQWDVVAPTIEEVYGDGVGPSVEMADQD